MTTLSSSSPVTATTMSGGRSMPARSSVKSSVASPLCTWCSSSASSRSKREPRCSISVTSWPARISDRARFEPTLPPPAMRMYMPLAEGPFGGADGVGEGGDRARRRADHVQPTGRVEVGPCRVEHPDDDGRHGELLLGHLPDDDVRVVAVGRDDDGVGVLDAGVPQQLDVHAVADEKVARPAVAETREGLFALIDDGDVPAGGLQLECDGRADAAASDHEDFHGAGSSVPK